MNKSTLIKWVVAAVLAVPAIPTFAKTVHHKVLVRRTGTHRLLTAAGKRHHVYHATTHRTTKLIVHRHLTHKLSTTHHGIRKTSLSSRTKTSTPFRVHFTKMPPTIDGINT
jgi:hypothetical protein